MHEMLINNIREALGHEVFLTRGEDEIRLDPALVWCDAVALSQYVRDGRWREALSLYRGELLEGLFPEGVAQEFQEWLSAQRKLLREQSAQAAWECSRLEEERGDRTAASVMARRARELDPDNEEGVRRLMGLLDRRGDRGSALRVYAEWQARLSEEFGVEPAPETRRLARQVQAARKGESHETAPVATPIPAVESAPTRETETVAPARVLAVKPARRWPTPILIAAGLVLLASLGSAAAMMASDDDADPGAIAVSPLRPIGDSTLKDVADAFTEELTTRLAAESTLTVHVSSLNESRDHSSDVSVLGRRLQATYVTDGGIQRRNDRIRVTLRLIRAADAVALWARTVDMDRAVVSDSAQQVAQEMVAFLARRISR